VNKGQRDKIQCRESQVDPEIEQNRSIEEELVQSLTLSRTPEKTTCETDADPAMPYVIGLYVSQVRADKDSQSRCVW